MVMREAETADRVQLEFEGSHDAEVAATAHAPEQIGVFAGTGPEDLPVGRDEVHRQQVIDGQSVFDHEPAQTPTESQTCQTSPAHGASRGSKAVDLGCLHELAKSETGLSPGRLLL